MPETPPDLPDKPPAIPEHPTPETFSQIPEVFAVCGKIQHVSLIKDSMTFADRSCETVQQVEVALDRLLAMNALIQDPNTDMPAHIILSDHIVGPRPDEYGDLSTLYPTILLIKVLRNVSNDVDIKALQQYLEDQKKPEYNHLLDEIKNASFPPDIPIHIMQERPTPDIQTLLNPLKLEDLNVTLIDAATNAVTQSIEGTATTSILANTAPLRARQT